MHKTVLDPITTVILMLVICIPMAVAGCAPGPTGKATYVVRRGGADVGTETVDVKHAGDGSRTYSGSAKRPFLPMNTSSYMKMTVGPDRKLVSFTDTIRKNGVTYYTVINRAEGGYTFLRDDLQTFDSLFMPFAPDGNMHPFEPDSAASVQALLDVYNEAQSVRVEVFAIVPSTTTLLRKVVMEGKGEGRMDISVKGLGTCQVAFDKRSGRLERSSNPSTGTVIELGSAGGMVSRPWAPTTMRVDDVRVEVAGGIELAGSLYLPQGDPPYRTIILEGDFGPWDRTGGGLFSAIADRLAGAGFAVLTCDRRGVRPSGGKYSTYTLETAVDDLNSQVEFLFLRQDVDPERIYVIGYGEGGVTTASVAQENPYVAGCVLMATPAVRMFPDLPLLQSSEALASGAISQPLYDENVAQVNRLLALLEAYPVPFLNISGHIVFLDWMRSCIVNDLPATAGELLVPVLVLQGANDAVVPRGQAEEIMRVLEGRTTGTQQLVILEGVDHSFGRWTGEAAAKPYRDHIIPADEVLDVLAKWFGEVR